MWYFHVLQDVHVLSSLASLCGVVFFVNHLDLFRDESTLSEVIIRATRTIQTRFYAGYWDHVISFQSRVGTILSMIACEQKGLVTFVTQQEGLMTFVTQQEGLVTFVMFLCSLQDLCRANSIADSRMTSLNYTVSGYLACA